MGNRIVIVWVVLLCAGCLSRGVRESCAEKGRGAVRVSSGRQFFESARAVWPRGLARRKNLFVGFRAVFERPERVPVILRIAGCSLYRIFLNGEFVGHGPARGPHDYYRVDEWTLADLQAGENVLAVEVAGYNVNSYYLLDEPSFLQAEVVAGGKVVASTAGEGVQFEACVLDYRVRKVQRYSFQRTFVEYYRLDADSAGWRRDKNATFEKVECEAFSDKKYLPRGVAYPAFFQCRPVRRVMRGVVETDVPVEEVWRDRALTRVGPKFKGFTEEELEVIPSIELQKIKTVNSEKLGGPYQPKEAISLGDKSFEIFDLGVNLTGFVGARIKCEGRTRLYITFDEILSDGDVNFKRLRCVNAIGYELEPGTYEIESFEPYTMRYVKFLVVEGRCDITNIYLMEYANPDTQQAHFACSDDRLNRLFEAARQTFRQNAVDIFMDCPSRERAGWLCDSFFTARVAFDLSGDTKVERNFFENFLLPERFKNIPGGMLPMCYPADHYDGRFIPNWAMWFVVELEEYLARSGDREMVDALEPRVMGLLDYFERFENEDGLLEKLESWVFVEWSRANDFVQDVSYPSNMLYAQVLTAAGRMYDKPELIEKAGRIRAVVREQSFDGEFFVDNAVRKDGKLEVTNNHSEICQYYAFFFDVASPGTHGQLRDKLMEQFGPQRQRTRAYPQVWPANSFVGNYLRLELLSRYGRVRQLKEELIYYFLHMAETTGTLWEHKGATGSCNHGFASHVAHCLYRDILGVKRIDTQNKMVELRFSDCGLQWCEGKMPTEDGFVVLSWRKEGNRISYKARVPAGYTLKVENRTGLELSAK